MIAYRKKKSNNQGNYSLLSIEESRLRVSEHRVLRKIFVSKRSEITGEWGRPA